MDKPHFEQHPPTEAELETLKEIMNNKNTRQAAGKTYKSYYTSEGHTKSLRFKYDSINVATLLARMFALGHIKREDLIEQLPESWRKYIIP